MTARSKSSAKPTKAKRASIGLVLKDLASLVRARPRKERESGIEGLRAASGDVAPDVSAFLDWYGAHAVRRIGYWHFATVKEMGQAPKKGAVAHVDPAALAAATGTLYVGKDGSGWRFFVERDRKRSEVFIHDPSTGQLGLVADSLRSFLELNELMLRWDQLCEAHDIDPDPDAVITVGTTTPGFTSLCARVRGMKGTLNLVDGSDYDETMTTLGRTTFRLKPTSDVLKRYAKAKHA